MKIPRKIKRRFWEEVTFQLGLAVKSREIGKGPNQKNGNMKGATFERLGNKSYG
jgi:hypothetical protein